MTPEIANVIAQFLQRVDLKGSEVQAYNACMEALQNFVEVEEPREEDSE